jgi:hypothetical protein
VRAMYRFARFCRPEEKCLEEETSASMVDADMGGLPVTTLLSVPL